jgi:hypothetical protein
MYEGTINHECEEADEQENIDKKYLWAVGRCMIKEADDLWSTGAEPPNRKERTYG